MNIDEVPAGREIDALVAEKVMGWTEVAIFHRIHCGVPPEGDELREDYYDTFFGTKVNVPNYSTDIAAAFRVVDKLRDGTRVFVLECWMPKEDGWQATFKGKLNWEAARYEQLADACTGTVPLAICRAALKVVANDQSNVKS